MLGGGLYASARLGFQSQVGSVAEVSRFSKGIGLETRPGPIPPTPGMDVASLVCALASLSVWSRHREWAPFPGYPLAQGSADRRQLLLPPPPPLLHRLCHIPRALKTNLRGRVPRPNRYPPTPAKKQKRGMCSPRLVHPPPANKHCQPPPPLQKETTSPPPPSTRK